MHVCWIESTSTSRRKTAELGSLSIDCVSAPKASSIPAFNYLINSEYDTWDDHSTCRTPPLRLDSWETCLLARTRYRMSSSALLLKAPFINSIPKGAALIGGGVIFNFQAIVTYVIDAFTLHAASGIAATAFLRSLCAFVFPLFAPAMYKALGFGWGNTVLAFASIILGCPAWVSFLFLLGVCVQKMLKTIFILGLRRTYTITKSLWEKGTPWAKFSG
jgi:hypothetical protein